LPGTLCHVLSVTKPSTFGQALRPGFPVRAVRTRKTV
jgi:hypothetical protein